MQSSMEKSCFAICLCCVSRVFGLTASLSANLQSHNFDHAQCIQHVDRVFNVANVMRNDAVSEFSWILTRLMKWHLHRLRDSSTTSMWLKSQSGFIWNIASEDIISTIRIYALDFLYDSIRIDFPNIAEYCATSAPCYRTALQGK